MKKVKNRDSSAKGITAYKNIQHINHITRNQIYNRLLELLANRQIRHKQSGKILPQIYYPKTSISDRQKIESDLFDIAIATPDYEVIYDVPNSLYYDLRQKGEIDLIFEKRAVPVPNLILNACVCETLLLEFKRDQILACDGFVLSEGSLRIDIDEKLARRGFIIPKITNGLIIGLFVFRYPNDEKPFILRTRRSLYPKGGDN